MISDAYEFLLAWHMHYHDYEDVENIRFVL